MAFGLLGRVGELIALKRDGVRRLRIKLDHA